MTVIRRTAQAEEDLVDIWLYIAQDNPGAADRLLDEIEENREPTRRCLSAPLRW